MDTLPNCIYRNSENGIWARPKENVWLRPCYVILINIDVHYYQRHRPGNTETSVIVLYYVVPYFMKFQRQFNLANVTKFNRRHLAISRNVSVSPLFHSKNKSLQNVV